MQIRVYDDFASIPLDRDGWNALMSRGSVNTVFQTFEWASAWWRTFGSSHRLICLTAEDGAGVIRGLFPFMLKPGTHELHFLADPNSDYCDFAAAGNRYATLDAVLRHLINEIPGWQTLTLRNIPEESTTLSALLTLCDKYRLHCRLSNRIAAPRIEFAHEAAPFRLKYSVRRHCNRLNRLGAVEYRVARDRRDLPAMLDSLYEQHIGRYQQKSQHSLFENIQCRRFYATLAEELMEKGWLHFSELRLNGRSVATHFGFEYGKVLTWYKPAFDVAYRQYSPGTVLIKHLVDYANERGMSVFDFTIGNEPFKERFSNKVAYNRTLIIHRHRPVAYLHVLKHHAGLMVKELRGRISDWSGR